MVDDYEWKSAGESSLPMVVEEMKRTVASGEAAGVRLWWPGEETGGNLLFMADGKFVSFLPVHQPKCISEAFPKFIDNGWYVARLVPALAPLGLSGIRTRDEYP